MKLLPFIFTLPLILSAKISPGACRIDYYWRDYFGKIPYDAVIGGYLPSGKPFYIGQVYIRNRELLPATIYTDKTSARTSAYNEVLETDKNIKILCSPYRHNFKWISTRSENLSKLTNAHVIVGGSEVGQTLYIGRVLEQNSLILGKIFNHSQPNKGIWVPSNGHEANYLAYDILTYSCNDIMSVAAA